ncbi:MAG: right-handed parallel beta-helix repeat-containing protein [Myxococcota bacterium]|nr:right-handed parallel beta-helix repeat-containing protein [Myxococcota bacterium]
MTNTLTGPVVRSGTGAEVTFENLEISGATSGINTQPGHGIECAMGSLGTLRLVDMQIQRNAGAGLASHGCTFEATRTEFRENRQAISAVDCKGTVSRSVITGNTSGGMFLDAGLYAIRNCFVFRNGGVGIEIYPSSPGNVVELNTIVDNTTGIGCISDVTTSGAFANNIIVRNTANTDGNPACTHPGSIIMGDAAALKFKSPDVAPFDYHITVGSIAIDQATPASTALTDYDGEPRPSGAARDVGADELH